MGAIFVEVYLLQKKQVFLCGSFECVPMHSARMDEEAGWSQWSLTTKLK